MESITLTILVETVDDEHAEAFGSVEVEGVRYITTTGPMDWGGDAAELAVASLMAWITPALPVRPARPTVSV